MGIMEEITICDLIFTEDERNLIINHWLKDYIPKDYSSNVKYFILNCVMTDMTSMIRDPQKFKRPVSILGRDSYTVPYIRILDKSIISFLMNASLGQKTFKNLPEQIKNKVLANSL